MSEDIETVIRELRAMRQEAYQVPTDLVRISKPELVQLFDIAIDLAYFVQELTAEES